jgi:hypothetical protein
MSGDLSRMAELGHDIEWIGQRVFIPSSLIAFVSGILLVVAIDGLGFGADWIVIGLVLYATTFLAGLLFLGPESGRIGASSHFEFGATAAPKRTPSGVFARPESARADSGLAQGLALEFHEQLAGGNAVASAYVHRLDLPFERRVHGDLHLHRLEYDEGSAGVHLVARLDLDTDHGARHRRGDCCAPFGGGTVAPGGGEVRW